jgi:penicillin-binding protein 1C
MEEAILKAAKEAETEAEKAPRPAEASGAEAPVKEKRPPASLGRRLARFFGAMALLSSFFLLLALLLADPPDPRDFPVSPIVWDSNGALLHVALSADEEYLMPEPLSGMGRWLPLVAVGIEDKRFFSHLGVDPLALARALWQNLKSARVVSGASTITVQLVRLSKPRPRTLASKMREFLEAVRLDAALSKEEILELYLNRAPFGGNLRGVGAASRAYFGKAPADLSLGESALLVALLRGPSAYRPDRRPALAKARRDFVLDLILDKGLAAREDVAAAKSEEVLGRRANPPKQAPHLSQRLIAAQKPGRFRWGAEGFRGIATTLDGERQGHLEGRLASALEGFAPEVAGAGLIMDNRTGAVLAHAGAVSKSGRPSFVDFTLARRSAGSTLKPFVYLAAFAEKGLNPSMMLADTPLALGGAAPRNFDGGYRGPVSAKKALAESLNAPAVRVLRMVGQSSALGVMGRAGLRLKAEGDYGDSLVLGGAETALTELAAAYGTLARGGVRVFPVYQKSEALLAGNSHEGFSSEAEGPWPENFEGLPPGASEPVLDPAAVWLVNQSLIDDGRLPPGLAPGAAAFKTGTSHGFRDAWLMAWTRDYTVGLWLGDPSGAPHEGLSGLSALGPAAVALLSSLGPPSPWPGPPAGLERYRACPLSGEPASPDCPGHVWAWRLARDRRTVPCALHAREGGLLVLRWPAGLSGFMSARGAPEGPKIASPADGQIFRLVPGASKIPLKSEGAEGVVHWFLDSEHLFSSKPGDTRLLPVTQGEHTIAIIDQSRQTARSRFTVLAPEIREAQVLTLK